MKVWVIMGNDYPDAVFDSENAAKSYVETKQAAERVGLRRYETPRIYWRNYEFELQH